MNRWTVLPSDLQSGDTLEVNVQAPAVGRTIPCQFVVKNPTCLVLEGATIVPVTLFNGNVNGEQVVACRADNPPPTLGGFYGKTLLRVATAPYDYNSDSGRTVFYFTDGTTLAVCSEAEMSVETARFEVIEHKEWRVHQLQVPMDTANSLDRND